MSALNHLQMPMEPCGDPQEAPLLISKFLVNDGVSAPEKSCSDVCETMLKAESFAAPRHERGSETI